jgi:5-methylcytosine-specific restriction endonuclease McrA
MKKKYRNTGKDQFYKKCVKDNNLYLDCPYCESTFFYLDAEIDHIEPISGLGTNSKSNKVPVCQTCNRSKSNKPLVSWLRANAISPEAVYKRLLNLKKTIPSSMLDYLGY